MTLEMYKKIIESWKKFKKENKYREVDNKTERYYLKQGFASDFALAHVDDAEFSEYIREYPEKIQTYIEKSKFKKTLNHNDMYIIKSYVLRDKVFEIIQKYERGVK
jgi:hypothetical protein